MTPLRLIADFGRRLVRDKRGASAVEYGILVCFVMLAIFAALAQVNTSLGHVFGELARQLDAGTR
ncbi:Flp family type IVb pilin [Sphingomonadaceae bacterium jetA1]|jgi:Flp pilus assembly pilin Flp|uniref:Flp family type IVb pilin n=1 Tax=Facivitalis istanbulensis TaxID=3075838 RepID=UPI00346BC308